MAPTPQIPEDYLPGLAPPSDLVARQPKQQTELSQLTTLPPYRGPLFQSVIELHDRPWAKLSRIGIGVWGSGELFHLAQKHHHPRGEIASGVLLLATIVFGARAAIQYFHEEPEL